ncbi:MAG: helix-turn-helix domain-containing protein [Oscillospiraceae bacterium]|nr:helix-turn-helix domain-containing protein [Oscillospiraceae bacterium]
MKAKIKITHLDDCVYYSPSDFAVRVDDTVLEFSSPKADSEGKRGSAQIKLLSNGELVKDEHERYSVDKRNIIWSYDIDIFAIRQFKGFKRFLADNMLTTAEVCDILGLSKTRIYALIQEGALCPAKRSGSGTIFSANEIEAYLKIRMGKYKPSLDKLSLNKNFIPNVND